MSTKWEHLSGRDAVSFREEGTLGDYIPSLSGIYCWKVNPYRKTLLPSDYDGILEQVCRLMTLPQFESGYTRINHSLISRGFSHRGEPISGDKYTRLREWLKETENAKWMISFLKDLSDFMPNLYVGKSENIGKRVGQHLSGTSNFGKKISDSADLSWEDLLISWRVIPDADSQLLEAVELVTTVVSLSGYVEKAG